MYILTPSMLREKGYVHDEHYHTANLSAIIHTFNNWLDTHRAQFIAQAKGKIVAISWLKRDDLSAYTEADIDEALVWFTKMGWEVEVVNKNSTDLVTYYVFRERKNTLPPSV
jgi:hypothetical protein